MTDTSKNGKWNIDRWQELVAPLECRVDPSGAQYEIAKVSGPGISLVIYPHKTKAGAHHARVRDNSSKNQPLAQQAIRALGLWCKTMPKFDNAVARLSAL